MSLTALLLLCLYATCDAAEILAVLPFPSYSHVMPFVPILKELGARNHSVVFVSNFQLDPNPKGFTQVKMNFNNRELNEAIAEAMGPMSLEALEWARGSPFELVGVWPICRTVTPLILEKTKPHLPPASIKFDLLIMEPFFCMEPLLGLSAVYNAPVVATLPDPLSSAVAEIMGNPIASAYVPNWKTSLGADMGFLERVWNTVVNTFELIGHHLYHIPRQDKVMREFFGNLPPLSDLLLNISLILSETHFSLSYPRPYLRNVVEVGGVSLQVAKPLTKELGKVMNESKDGVILFSWGSHFDAPDADAVAAVMMKAFRGVKQRVLFKWNRPIPDLPNNVIVQNWFPQPSILAHENTVLFVSHGGLNSMYEAAYHGVPVLGTPLFGDHAHNLRILQDLGMSLSVPLKKLKDGTTFATVLTTMLSDARFRENARKISRRVRDRPLDVVEEAAYWIEHLLRHGGRHLEPVTKRMPWYSRACLDVWLFLLCLPVLPGLVLLLVVRRWCCGRRSQVSSGKKSQ